MPLSSILACAVLLAAPASAAAPEKIDAETQKTLYAVGADVAQSLMEDFLITPKEMPHVIKGLQEHTAGKKLLAEPTEYTGKIRQLRYDRQEKVRTEFLAAAAAKPGAQKSESGLIYRELKAGTGEKPSAENTVKVHYHGTFPNGKVFDSSVQRNDPAEFPLKGVIPCWTEGVQKIAVGGKGELICPFEIAYGAYGRPPQIPARATLVFEVELLEIKKEEPAPEPAAEPAEAPKEAPAPEQKKK